MIKTKFKILFINNLKEQTIKTKLKILFINNLKEKYYLSIEENYTKVRYKPPK